MNLASEINLNCACSTLQPRLLDAALAQDRPHLFSATPVFITADDLQAMRAGVEALHRVASLPGFQQAALARSPQIAAHSFGPQGAFMGYDFHIGEDGPRLIEINTNAGGALLHAQAARAHRACCEPLDWMFGEPTLPKDFDAVVLAMFHSEWHAQRGDLPLRTIAIVDVEPAGQYLAPEFELARQLFERSGIRSVVCDPSELRLRDGALWHSSIPGLPIDLVYNRLTDFCFAQDRHEALRAAYVSGAAVVTPHPRAHALHADKRNLVALSDDALLKDWGATDQDRETLRRIVPRTRRVADGDAHALWAERKNLFFKPAGGYGSKAAYRGDKLTRRVWDDILAGDFVAQDFVAPSERLVAVGDEFVKLKLDVRAYAYAGAIQLLAARTYAGQTTNFRTAGGGFSPVVVLPPANPHQEIRHEALPRACAC